MSNSISEILNYPINKDGTLVTRRSGLARMKPKLSAPPPNQVGSVDWWAIQMFQSRQRAIDMIESLVAGQGDNADEKWLRVVLLYKQWEIQHKRGEIPEPPTLNQVCHSLNFDAGTFQTELQNGVMNVMQNAARGMAIMASTEIMEKVIERAKSDNADIRERELPLKIAGVIDEKGNSVNVQINNQQNNIMLKSEKEKMKTPLLQFSDTIIDIDNEVRREQDENDNGGK